MTWRTCTECGSEEAPYATVAGTPTGGVNLICPDCFYVRDGPEEGRYYQGAPA